MTSVALKAHFFTSCGIASMYRFAFDEAHGTMVCMKLMGEITCRIAPDAIKPNVLHCTEPEALRLDAWTVSAAWLTALATVALALIAIYTGYIAIMTLRQMKSDSIAQTRPYVHAQVVPSIAGIGTYDIILRNSGKTTAQRLQIVCPEFPQKPDDIALKLKELFTKSHTLPPDSQLRSFWRFTVPEGGKWQGGGIEPAGMPELATLIVSYSGPAGNYEEVFPVDLAVYRMAPVPDDGPDAQSNISADQKDTHKMLAVIARNIRELGR